VSRDAHLAMTVSTKFEVDTTPRCLVNLTFTTRVVKVIVINTVVKSRMEENVTSPQ